MPRRLRACLLATAALLAGTFATEGGAGAVTVPPGFTDALVASVAQPTALAFTPDGRLLIATQPGLLRVYRNGALLPAPALDLSSRLCADRERGLLGVAVDPAFSTNGFVYVYSTFAKFGTCEVNSPNAPVNRVSRFTLGANNTINPASERVLLDNIPSPAGNHNGGDVHIGANGFLYVAVGDGGCRVGDATRCAAMNNNARRLDLPLGKVLRVRRDGLIPAGNPWAGAAGSRRCGNPAGVPAGTGPCQEIFAFGLRNPFRLAFRPGTNQFHINDVGQDQWEEIDANRAGADYGWNVREGRCVTGSATNCGPAPAGMTNPIASYSHASGCRTITGGAFVPAGLWPSPYSGAYLFGDFICGTIFRLAPNASGGFNRVPFATNLGGGSVVSMRFGPFGGTQALYYATYANGGQVRRIAATG